MNRNPKLVEVPCRRVVYSKSEIGGYAQGLQKKIGLLQNEGVVIMGRRVEKNGGYSLPILPVIKERKNSPPFFDLL